MFKQTSNPYPACFNPAQGQIILFYWGEAKAADHNVKKLADFVGITIAMRRVDHGETIDDGDQLTQVGCAIVSAETLQFCRQSKTGLSSWWSSIVSKAADVLVYGFEPSTHDELLRDITSGSVSGVEPLGTLAGGFTMQMEAQPLCRQLAGLTVAVADSNRDYTFKVKVSHNAPFAVIRIAERPFFACVMQRSCRVLLLACRDVADLDESVAEGNSPLPWFSRLIPFLMVLKWASGDWCWRSDTPSACFVLDDPLLRPKYGFVEFVKLLELMESRRFCTSLAFIPWNWRRSSPKIAKLFNDFPHRYSMCIHGCDHTANEFGTGDKNLMRMKAKLALDRMESHRQVSAVHYDDVMVFPQGVFTTSAMEALDATGYLAAVNSTPYPIDSFAHKLTLRDLLDVAITCFSGIPLFLRHYPNDLSGLAFDLFLGKPALLVEHHDYFREGYVQLGEAVCRVNALDRGICWGSLGDICSGTCMKKTEVDGSVHVRFYTKRFRLHNDKESAQRYVLSRRICHGEVPPTVTINQCQAVWRQIGDYIEIPLLLEAGQVAETRLHFGHLRDIKSPRRQARLYDAKVFLRRHLCEFRDNHIHTNCFLNGLASATRRAFARRES